MLQSKDLPTIHQSPEMEYLRDWVTANDETRYDGQAQGTLRLDVTHSNLVQRWHDIIFETTMTVAAVKEKLYRHGGTPAKFQELYLRRGGGDTIFLSEDCWTLGRYSAKSGMEIHIKDTDEFSISKHGGLEDVSQVEKFVMSDEQYDKLDNTVRAIKRKEQLARAKAEASRREAGGQELGSEHDLLVETVVEDLESVVARIPIGSRCKVEPGSRRGEIAHVGPVAGTNETVWIGVRLDEPQGNNDGSAKDGTRYFDCPGPKYGCFAKPENVEVGDFPPLDPFASDDEF